MPLIELRDVSYSYDAGKHARTMALSSISLSIQQGDFIGIVGCTGSGKTTLLQLLNGIRKPTEGTVSYRGKDIWQDKLCRKQLRFEVGFVFQYPESQLFEETVEKDIAYGPRNMGLDEKEVAYRVREIADLFHLSDSLLKRNPFELSGGEKRRVAIAGVLAMQPKVLVLDEPTVGLDPKGRNELLNFIRSYYHNYGITVFMSSHNMDQIATLSSKVLVLDKGKIVNFDTPSVVFSDSIQLKELGLSLPSYAEIFNLLKQQNIDVKTDIFTLEDAKQECLRLFKQRRGIDA